MRLTTICRRLVLPTYALYRNDNLLTSDCVRFVRYAGLFGAAAAHDVVDADGAAANAGTNADNRTPTMSRFSMFGRDDTLSELMSSKLTKTDLLRAWRKGGGGAMGNPCTMQATDLFSCMERAMARGQNTGTACSKQYSTLTECIERAKKATASAAAGDRRLMERRRLVTKFVTKRHLLRR
eukprot:PLAT15137.3.p1 GENE.PLAT15137.3~~PLAT15137.3.p1  ORF type:complete len:181 (-),score=33.19 PLAT15137.3:83-625(-)